MRYLKKTRALCVTLDLNTERWDEMRGFVNSVKDPVAAFPGLISWVLVANRQTGRGTSFSVFENEEAFLSVNDQINRIVSDFGQFFVAPPDELLGDVLVHVDNGLTRT